jgi:AcrR family transcriptional regulator
MGVQPMGIREQQKEKRRNEILLAGLDLFIRKGYSATKIKDIADQVGMSVGLLFHYFESKEKLYEELIKIGVMRPMSIVANTDMEPLRFFQLAVEQIFYCIKTEPFTAKMFVLMNQALYNEAVPQKVKELLQDFDVFTPAVKMIERGQTEGTIREGDPYALVIALWCGIQGIAEQIAMHPSDPCPEAEWMIDMIRRR